MSNMERDAQIRQTAAEWLRYNHPTCTQDMLVEAFRCGAEWADKHKPNPWKNVNDELPKDHEKIFFRKKDGSKYCGWFDEKLQSFLTITPDVTKWTINGITHWMKVPDMPADILNP